MDVLIVGASTRAAAHSALRAGLTPAAIDLFADRDLKAVARCARIDADAYPSGLIGASRNFPDGPVVYTGAAENFPEIVAALSRDRLLWGNDAPTLRAVRHPLAVAETLRAAGLPGPEVRLDSSSIPRDGSWLRKPLASAAGLGIEPFGPETGDRTTSGRGSYYQEWLEGEPLSAVFVGGRFGAVLVGISLQLIGRPCSEFAYRGNLAPWPVSLETRRQVAEVGDALTRAFGLVGFFGVDFVLNAKGPRPRVVEVNPRYPASVEVLELATGVAWFDAHRSACEGGDVHARPPASNRCVAKEVVFATESVVFDGPDIGPPPIASETGRFAVPEAADLPEPGARFEAGDPVVTVFGHGASSDECLEVLANARRRWQSYCRAR